MFLLIITRIILHWVSNLGPLIKLANSKNRGISIQCIFLLTILRKIRVRMGFALWMLTRATSASLILKCSIKVIRTISILTLISINSCRRGMLRITLIWIKRCLATNNRDTSSKDKTLPTVILMLNNIVITISSTNQWADTSRTMIPWDICHRFLLLGFRRPRAKDICTKVAEEIWEFHPQYI